MDWSKEFGYSHDKRSIYSIVLKRQHDEFNRRLLIHGNVQSGKTHVSQCCTLFHVLEKNCIGVHIVRNLNMDKTQYVDRLKRFVERSDNRLKIIDTQTPFDQEETLDEHPCVIIVMANDSQFRTMDKYLETSKKKIHITIDESDSITVRTRMKKKQAERFNDISAKYQHRIVEKVYITATIDLHVFRYDESQTFRVCDIVSLRKSENYVGFEDIGNWNTFDFNDKFRMTCDNFKYISNILKTDMFVTPQRIIEGKRIPKLMNLHISFVIKHHEDVVHRIVSNMNITELPRITFMKHDTSRLEVQFYSEHLYDLIPHKNTPKKYHKERLTNGFVKHMYEKGSTTIRDILLLLKNDSFHNHENIVFINGKSDGRGVSVNSEERTGTVFIGWNIVILPTKTNLSNITQIAGRQCGRYTESGIVRRTAKIYVTEKTKEDIFKYCSFINYFLNLLSEARDSNISVVEFIENVFKNRGIRTFPMNSSLWNSQIFGNIPFRISNSGNVVFNATTKKCVFKLNEEPLIEILRNIIFKDHHSSTTNRTCYELVVFLTRQSKMTYNEALDYFDDNDLKMKKFFATRISKVFMHNSKTKIIMIHPQILPFIVETFRLSIQYVNSFEKHMDEFFIV